jgi:hypothetical protein
VSCIAHLGISIGTAGAAPALLALVVYRAAEWLISSSAFGIFGNVILEWFALFVAFALPAFGVMRFDASVPNACGDQVDGAVLLSMYLLFPTYLLLLSLFYRKRKLRLRS